MNEPTNELGCVDRGWIDTSDPRYVTAGIWTINAPLLPDPASPLGQKYAQVFSWSLEDQIAFGKNYFPRIIDAALSQVYARCVSVDYSFGARGDVFRPEFSLALQSSHATASDVGNLLGYLGQLSNFQLYKPESMPDGRGAMDVSLRTGLPLPLDLASGFKAVMQSTSFAATIVRPADDGRAVCFLDNLDNWTADGLTEFVQLLDAFAKGKHLALALDRLIVSA